MSLLYVLPNYVGSTGLDVFVSGGGSHGTSNWYREVCEACKIEDKLKKLPQKTGVI